MQAKLFCICEFRLLYILHLSWVQHSRCHHCLLLRVYITLHTHVRFTFITVLHDRLSQLKFWLTMCERAFIPIWTVSTTFKEFTFDSLIIAVFVLISYLELSTCVVTSTLEHTSITSTSSITTWHVCLHSPWTLEVCKTSSLKATTATSRVVTGRTTVLKATSEVSLLVAIGTLSVGIWRSGVDGHASHSCSLLMLRNWLIIMS